MRALARDPEIVAMLEAGNTVGLLMHPRILGLAERLTAATADAPRGLGAGDGGLAQR